MKSMQRKIVIPDKTRAIAPSDGSLFSQGSAGFNGSEPFFA